MILLVKFDIKDKAEAQAILAKLEILTLKRGHKVNAAKFGTDDEVLFTEESKPSMFGKDPQLKIDALRKRQTVTIKNLKKMRLNELKGWAIQKNLDKTVVRSSETTGELLNYIVSQLFNTQT